MDSRIKKTSLGTLFLLGIWACGATTVPPVTVDPQEVDSDQEVDSHDDPDEAPPAESELSALVGPFVDFDEICGAELPPLPDSSAERRERCRITARRPLTEGTFIEIATYVETRGSFAEVALRTDAGWFVRSTPGERFVPQLSHHTPSSSSFDLAATRFQDGTLKLISRGSGSSFMPGQGSAGSSRRRWADVTQCRVTIEGPACGFSSRVYERICQSPMIGSGPDVCRETGRDVL